MGPSCLWGLLPGEAGGVLAGSQHEPPSAGFDHWSQLVSASVLRSSRLARGCKVAFAEDPAFPSVGTVCPSLAWGHPGEVLMASGSVPCTSLGRVGSMAGASPGGCSGTRLPGDTGIAGSW